MSFTTVKDIWPGERHESLEEPHNSYGSAPVVWGELCERYLGGRDQWLFKSNQLWSLYKREDAPACMRAVLMMTFDLAYVEKKDYAKAAADIEEFLRIAPAAREPRKPLATPGRVVQEQPRHSGHRFALHQRKRRPVSRQMEQESEELRRAGLVEVLERIRRQSDGWGP